MVKSLSTLTNLPNRIQWYWYGSVPNNALFRGPAHSLRWLDLGASHHLPYGINRPDTSETGKLYKSETRTTNVVVPLGKNPLASIERA
jgi:hypothetical protein